VLRSILIGLDTSEHVDALAELGVRWSRRFGATLVGLAIVDEPGIHAIEPLGPIGGTPGVNPVYYMGYENRMEEHRQRAERLLADFAVRCGQASAAHEQITKVGSPHELIAREAGARDLVVLPLRSHFQFTAQEEEPDDGLLRRVLKDTPRPVVVVPDAPTPTRDGPVVIAYDGSLQAERALSAFEATGLAETGPVHIVSVDSHPDEATRRAGHARQWLALHGVQAQAHAMTSAAPPAVVILEEARHLGAGLLVMGAYGQPVLREFFLGSATRSLLAECSIPMFLFH
jgi:nucleotide-binding universal stress UspA family protein